ncbi:MAG: hypothetical protein CVU05_08605 [Bacteroidetes bacterium HGW-Bacteroidetes-21]|nr:MAG: hypothetical protein CVU05_08605 [Bacteroidetes bacterium HGW-Bacteroidetes-21]
MSSLRGSGQENTFFTSNYISPELKENKLIFHYKQINFFKNNEYFNNLYDGITYLGTRINPEFSYSPSTNFTVTAGWMVQYFSGREKAYLSQPTLTANWQFAHGYKLIMGNIQGSLNHLLPDPLFTFDKYYISPEETGIQFLANSKYHITDIWLNWEKFILPGDDFKEEFTAGGKTILLIIRPSKGVGFSLPMVGMAMHKGGQVENTSGHLQTVFNSAVGINLYYKPTTEKKDSLGIQTLFCGFMDGSPYKGLLYSRGWGIYSNAYIKLSDWYFEAGYWHGKHFIAPRGEWLFQSISSKYGMYWEPSKDLIFAKAGWKHDICNGVKVGTGGGLFFDTQRNTLDFYYQLHMIINLDFPIRVKNSRSALN